MKDLPSVQFPLQNEVHPFLWTDKFLLGFGRMDKVHMEFVTLLSELLEASDDSLADCLRSLRVHTEDHFQQENQWMEETGFPPRDCHIEQHNQVLASMRQVEGLLESGDFATCRALANALVDWFPEHADYLDSALAQWMCKRTLGGVPVILRRSTLQTDFS